MLTEIRDFLARKIKQSRDYCKPIVTIKENKNRKYVRGTRLLGGATWALTSLQLSLTTFAIAAVLSSVSRFINFPSLKKVMFMDPTLSPFSDAYFKHLRRLPWLRPIFYNKLTCNQLFGVHFFCFLMRISIMYVNKYA